MKLRTRVIVMAAVVIAVPTLVTLSLASRAQQREPVKVINEVIERTNVPIKFWGQVVDQNQQPIGGVAVQYNYSTEQGNITGAAWGEQKLHKSKVTTDAGGMFQIEGIKGHTLTVESLTKEGYTYTPRGANVYNYFGDTPSGRFMPESTKPVVFVMIGNATAESLVSYGGSFGKTLRLPASGAQVRWNVWKGEPDPNGELYLTFRREPAVLARIGDASVWSAKLGISGGGVVEASPSEGFYRAPEEGYIAEIDYPKTEQKRGVPARSFYIKTSEGKHGRLELNLYPDDEGATARCLIKAVMNPSGSRVLE